MRYHIKASFQEEQRKGFIVTHHCDKDCINNVDLTKQGEMFLSSYNHEYCHDLDFHVTEKNNED